jgi:chromosome segregation ATPase
MSEREAAEEALRLLRTEMEAVRAQFRRTEAAIEAEMTRAEAFVAGIADPATREMVAARAIEKVSRNVARLKELREQFAAYEKQFTQTEAEFQEALVKSGT